TFPGPLISAQKGDTLNINVTNLISSPRVRRSTTIHWHGIFQHRTSGSDGTAQVSQCPISPSHSFQYQFGTDGQAGTFWYHSHLGTQYCDGLVGPLVIYGESRINSSLECCLSLSSDPQDPLASLYDVDNQNTIITIGDWNHLPANEAFRDTTILQPNPDSVIINGNGRFVRGPEFPVTPWPVSVIGPVTRNLRYRFRIINTSCYTFFNVSIDKHTMTVIEADGTEVNPLTVDSFTIFPGQRYSVIVKADQPVGNYWFRTTPTPNITNWDQNKDPAVNNAIFRYEGAPIAEPTTTFTPPTKTLREWDMPGGTGLPDKTFVVPINLATIWTLGNGSFFGTAVPTLMQILTGSISAQKALGDDNVVTIGYNETIDLTLVNDCDPGVPCAIEDNHPLHLHGHEFAVIQAANQPTPNYKNPPRRDTVAIYNGNVTIRFNTLNPGPWIFHCHIDWHLAQGMALVFAEAPDRIKSGPDSVILPPGWKDLCTIYDSLPPDQQ
ncbi:laccase, partial [Sistotremastrum niveocremeum HHB9708]